MNEKWRVGTKVPLNIYRDDVPICQCHSDIDSRFIVAGMNQVEYLLESERSLREQNDARAEQIRALREALDDCFSFLKTMTRHQSGAAVNALYEAEFPRFERLLASPPDPGQWKERT